MTDSVPRLPAVEIKLDSIHAAVMRLGRTTVGAAEFEADLGRIGGAVDVLRDRLQMLFESALSSDAGRWRHDLRTPLNQIIGYGEMLLQEAEEDRRDELIADLTRVVRGGREVLGDIDGLVQAALSADERPAKTPVGVLRRRAPPAVTTVRERSALHGRILVVDDNAGNRDLLCRWLERRGHTPLAVSDGVEALERLEAGRFDVVLLDLDMPRLSGIEVLELMRQDPVLRTVPVIVISGNDDMNRIVACIELGAADHLAKPFEPVLLQARIDACLQRKALQDQATLQFEQARTERERANQLLRVILPDAVVAELQSTGNIEPRRHEQVAVLFCDIVGFTAYSERHEPEVVLANLQQLVEAFEGLMGKHRMQKIKTIGDSFMAAAGLLEPLSNPTEAAVRCGLDMIQVAERSRTGWGIRVGISLGPVVAGVLGRQQYQYDLWGDTVNTAARVEASGIENAVCVNEAARAQLIAVDGLTDEFLGSVKMKGKGRVPLYRIALDPEIGTRR